MACINQRVMGTRVLVWIISKTMILNLADYFESGRAESNKHRRQFWPRSAINLYI